MKKYIHSKWLLAGVALIIGALLGILGTRWYYHSANESHSACGSVEYYDQSGKTKLHTDTTCE